MSTNVFERGRKFVSWLLDEIDRVVNDQPDTDETIVNLEDGRKVIVVECNGDVVVGVERDGSQHIVRELDGVQ